MSPVDAALLVVAKAPVPGLAKTRLAASIGPGPAADLAAAALLDTLNAVRDADVAARIVALTGDLGSARRAEELVDLLAGCVVIAQHGDALGQRLAAAHRDAANLAPGPVLQIGMDTPQVTASLLTAAAAELARDGVDAVYGPATDGGWWALGLADPHRASFLAGVVMSRADTGARTLAGLQTIGPSVSELVTLTDVDTVDDVFTVASELGRDSQFLRAAEAGRTTSW
jgi:glycosyltransferase A (GT-A) superfamily protein (DUF2064 family)